MNNIQIIITILLLALSVAFTRFIPFVVFKNSDKMPKLVDYLGKVLPAAMMGLLVVYCLKDINYTDLTEVIPTAISILTVTVLHLWKRNTILSISVGTVLYMILIRIF